MLRVDKYQAIVPVPMALLTDRKLTDADKHLWMMMRLDQVDRLTRMLDPQAKLTSPTRLANRTNLARCTIYRSRLRLKAAGWYDQAGPATRKSTMHIDWVPVPESLLVSDLPAREVVTYCLLQHNDFRLKGEFTYGALSLKAQKSRNTIKRSIKLLKELQWIDCKQENSHRPICFQLRNPQLSLWEQDLIKMDKRLSTCRSRAQALATEMVLFLTKQTEYSIDYKPSFLRNDNTEALLEIDLMIDKLKLAVEYNGEQHYHSTSFCSPEETARQQERDTLKAKLLQAEHYKLVVLTANDLSLITIKNKLSCLAPMVGVEGRTHIARFLEDAGSGYRRVAYRHELDAAQEEWESVRHQYEPAEQYFATL